MGNKTWKHVHTGEGHILGIQTNGSLWGMGTGHFGQLGPSSVNKSADTFIQIGSSTNWETAAAGDGFSIGVQANGTLWSFGNNMFGSLGLGHDSNKTSLTQIGTDTTWKSVYTWRYSVLGLKRDSSLRGWGDHYIAPPAKGSVPTYIPMPVSAGQTVACVRTAAPTGVAHAVLKEILMFPNPVRDVLKVYLSGDHQAERAVITDINGRRVATNTEIFPGRREMNIDVRSLAPGLYFLTVHSGDGRFQTRFIKE
jgi:hypothetical protein